MTATAFPSGLLGRTHLGDCIEGMNSLPEGCVDLIFADPPFNIGYDYDVYHDRKERNQYLTWSRDWIASAHRVLKADGTFWLAIGDDYAAELKLLSQDVGFHCRSWVIWYYTFGVNCKNKFSRSHTHIFHFVKDPDKFTFRINELENRIPSARQLVYADTRGNPRGRLPDDTWILRPQDQAGCFAEEEDTWYFPRVAGTFKERAGFHGCQMPEQLLGRIIRLCSREGEMVLDPFSGSGTTLAVAKKLYRQYAGYDMSDDYVLRGNERLSGIRAGEDLVGAPEPTMSAPSTKKGKRLKDKLQRGAKRTGHSVGESVKTTELLPLFDGNVISDSAPITTIKRTRIKSVKKRSTPPSAAKKSPRKPVTKSVRPKATVRKKSATPKRPR